MAPSALQCLSALLCLASIALLATAASQSESSLDAADSAPSRLTAHSLAHILRRRSSEMAPPNYYASRLANFLRPVEAKRDDGYWIWMPAHGYMSVPRDEVVSSSGDKDNTGTLLRYGK